MAFFDSFLGGLFGVADSAMQTNMDWNINEANLAYQRERNEIEDERYEEETEYNRNFAEEQQNYERNFAEEEKNYQRAFAEEERDYNRAFSEDERDYQRAFAENEREYNRALQQEIFRREDTALERQAESLSKMGINPLSQNMSGLGTGQAITSSMPNSSSAPSSSAPSSSAPSSSAPSMSSRGGKALHNAFQAKSFLAPVLGMLDTINGIQTGEYNRDKLQLENDRMFLENMALANEYGINYTPNLGFKNKYKDSRGKHLSLTEQGIPWTKSKIGSLLRNNYGLNEMQKYESLNHKLNHNIYDGADSKLNFLRELSTTDFSKIAEDFVTNIADSYSKIGDDFKKRFGGKSTFADKFYNFLW